MIAHKAQARQSPHCDTLAEYGYDEAHRLRLARNSESELQFEYDVLGRLVSQICKKSDRTDRLQYRYDANGNRTQTQFPNGETIDYLYYGSGHLTAIKYNGNIISEFERDKLHREITRTQGRLTTHYELDPVGKLKAQLNAQIERHYHYDNAGNLTQSKDNLTQTTQYGYDKLGRLTHATSPLSRETFAFDPAHNIIEHEGQKQQNNQVNHYHGTQYRYDGLGNLIERKLPTGEIQQYRYNLNDQLIEASITKSNGRTETWRYAYDPLGRRTDKRSETHKNLHTKFVWDGSHLIQERNEQETYTYLYTHPNSYEPLAQIKENGKVYYYHCDQIGAPRELTNQNGELCWHASYKGWGELQGEHNLKAVHQPIRLQNQYFDKETGLHYNFFRYYEPTIGRFTTQDPIGLAGGENLYRFADNTQGWIDPLGLNSYPTPPSNIPGGPWTPTNSPPGGFNGTKPSGAKGPRPFCQYVPAEGEGGRGMKGAKESYFKIKKQGEKGWQRYNMKGEPITPEQAHPGNKSNINKKPNNIGNKLSNGIDKAGVVLFFLQPTEISRCQDTDYARANRKKCNYTGPDRYETIR